MSQLGTIRLAPARFDIRRKLRFAQRSRVSRQVRAAGSCGVAFINGGVMKIARGLVASHAHRIARFPPQSGERGLWKSLLG